MRQMRQWKEKQEAGRIEGKLNTTSNILNIIHNNPVKLKYYLFFYVVLFEYRAKG